MVEEFVDRLHPLIAKIFPSPEKHKGVCPLTNIESVSVTRGITPIKQRRFLSVAKKI
jgi:hypothetical protein